jgi:hypothetical protein
MSTRQRVHAMPVPPRLAAFIITLTLLCFLLSLSLSHAYAQGLLKENLRLLKFLVPFLTLKS